LEKFVADLKAKAKVEIFEDNLAKLELPEPPPSPLGPHRPGPPGMGPRVGDPKKMKPSAPAKPPAQGAKKAAE
jgi:hypothetical protein